MIKEEIEADDFEKMMTELVDSMLLEREGFSLLVHGQGSQTRSFYRQLKSNSDIEFIWTDWSGPWWSYLFRFIPGESGLVRIKNIKNTKSIYEEIGAQSFCGLYFIPKHKEGEITDLIKNKKDEGLNDIFVGESEYFLLETDFDFHGGERDGEIYFRLLTYGDNLDPELKRILKINEQKK